MAIALPKTALPILLQHVQVRLLVKQPVAETVNNVAPIPVLAALNLIPVLMRPLPNVVASVIIATPVALPEVRLIPVR